MEWRDEGLIIGVRRHGETSVIAEIFTREHGRHLGIVRGGRGKRMQPLLQPGNSVAIVWRARLEEHLGMYTVEALKLPWLKIIGGVLLLWIATKLLMPEEGDDDIESSDNLIQAIKTILIADLVMSLDNVIAVAAAANGSLVLMILGLAISIPMIVAGAALIMALLDRVPALQAEVVRLGSESYPSPDAVASMRDALQELTQARRERIAIAALPATSCCGRAG